MLTPIIALFLLLPPPASDHAAAPKAAAKPAAQAATKGANQDEIAAWVGTWEGESKCTVPKSSCHDEHALYEIRSTPPGLTIAGYKVVNGKNEYMGDLVCGAVKDNQVSCSVQIENKKFIDDWVFQRKGNTLDGTLYMDKERIVFRKIHLTKK